MRVLWVARGVSVPFAVALAVWVGASGARPVAAADSDKLLAEVRSAWERREAATKTVRMAWDFKRVTPKGTLSMFVGPNGKDGKARPPADVTHDGKAAVLFDGLLSRYTLSDHIWSEKGQRFALWQSDRAFSGGVLKSVDHFDVQDWPGGSVKKGQWAGEGITLYDWAPLVAVRGVHPEVMYDNALGLFTEARRATLDGAGVVELTRPRTEVDGESKIWVSPDSDYSLVRYESFRADGELEMRVTATPQRHPSGVWLPAKWSGSFFAKQRRLLSAVTATMTAVEVAPPVTPADFELTFPPGTWVCDNTGNKPVDYVVKGGDQKRVVLPAEMTAPYEDLVRTETGALVPKSGPERNWLARNWWLGGAGGVLLVAVVWAVYRGTRRVMRGPLHSNGE